MDKHMPTPWTVGAGPHGEVEIWGRMRMGQSPILASMEHDPREANAAFIVRACNAHDELCQAVEAALNLVDGDGAPPRWDWMREALARARK